jgi:hypothetical protein
MNRNELMGNSMWWFSWNKVFSISGRHGLWGFIGGGNHMCPAIYCVKQNTVSTLAFDVHLFNFPL